jgi:hypothetical protein
MLGTASWQRVCRVAPVALGSLVLVLLLFLTGTPSRCQTAPSGSAGDSAGPYSRLHTWSVFGEFSPNSHHIFLGDAQQRRIVSVGGEYARRLVLKHWWELDYLVQARPLFLERDPVLLGFRSVATNQVVLRFPQPQRVVLIDRSTFLLLPPNVLVRSFYGSEWTYAGGLHPAGFKMSLFPHRKLQPVMTGSAGFVVSTRDIPVDASESFNFTFELGVGLEYYLRPKHSLRFDYRIHHLSNAYRGILNPGIDSNLFQISYSFGR